MAMGLRGVRKICCIHARSITDIAAHCSSAEDRREEVRAVAQHRHRLGIGADDTTHRRQRVVRVGEQPERRPQQVIRQCTEIWPLEQRDRSRGRQARRFLRKDDRVPQAADLVHQAMAQTADARVDPSLRDLRDPRGLHVPTLGDRVHETVVEIHDHGLGARTLLLGNRAVRNADDAAGQARSVVDVGVVADLHVVVVDPELLRDPVIVEMARDHADRTGDGQRRGQDLVPVHGDPVAPGAGDLALAHDHRLDLRGLAQLTRDEIGRQGIPARRIGAQHDRTSRADSRAPDESSC